MSDEARVGEDERLLDIAASLADGAAVDWAAVEGTAAGDDKALIRALRDIAGIAEAHRSWQGAPTAGDGADPERWGDLEILGRLGEGSYGDVYRARDPRLDREVALKLLRDGDRESDGDRAVQEGRLLARVHHPNVATVYGAARRDGRTGIWMELISGRTLAEVVREQGPFGAREAALIILDVCRALAAVHAQGIVHRDIKAQNVMRATGGRIVLTDFGIGREIEREETGGEERSLSGTPLYLAPEIFRGEKASVRSDLYSLGVLLYHLVTGKFPVRGASLAEIRRAHEQGDVRLLRDERPDLPESFIRVVERALSPYPMKRYGSAGAFEQALSGVLEFDETGVQQPRSSRSRRLRLVYAALALMMVVAVVGVLLWDQQRRREEAERLVTQAEGLYTDGEIEQASNALKLAIETDPNSPSAYRLRAIMLDGVGRYEEALEASQRAHALRKRAEPEEQHRISAIFHVYRLQYEDALRELESAVLLEPGDPWSLHQLAMLQGNLGEAEAGLAHAERAGMADPENVIRRASHSFLLTVANRPGEALEEVESLRKIFGGPPKGTYLFWVEGLAWLGKGDPEKAKAAFSRMREGEITYSSWAGLSYTQSLVYQGRLAEALGRLETELGLDLRKGYQKNAAIRRYYLARIYALLGEREEVRSNLKQITQLKDLPIFLKELQAAAVLFVELGDIQAAHGLLRRIEHLSKLYPSDLSGGIAAQVRGEIEAAQGFMEAAGEDLEAARLQRKDPSILRSLARFRLSQGEYDRAIPILDQILKSKGWIMQQFFAGDWVLAHLDLARCQRALGKTDEARESYEQFLSLWSNDDLAVVREARAELAELPRSSR